MWFLENNRALPKFLHGILHHLTSIIKLLQNQSIKNNFISTTQATLNKNNKKLSTCNFIRKGTMTQVLFEDQLQVIASTPRKEPSTSRSISICFYGLLAKSVFRMISFLRICAIVMTNSP